MAHDIAPLPHGNNLCPSLSHCCSLEPLSPLPPPCCLGSTISQESQAAEEEPGLLSDNRFLEGQKCCILFHTQNEEKSKKISTCIRIHTLVCAKTWWWGQICPPPSQIGLNKMRIMMRIIMRNMIKNMKRNMRKLIKTIRNLRNIIWNIRNMIRNMRNLTGPARWAQTGQYWGSHFHPDLSAHGERVKRTS